MILEKIKSPKDLKKVHPKDFKTLAQELRDKIISQASEKGGHLAPSLGVVELSIALHSVFSTPKDQIVWDVGHQAYAHKLLTGRQKEFSTIRQENGISGFPKRSESEHDAFGVGHSSTSISAALGMAAGRDLLNKKNKVIAVIGDGALTGGEALEGLNNAGYMNRDILIVLNDNRMSISPNVGALAEHSKRIKNTKAYLQVRNNYKKIKKSLPKNCKKLAKVLKKHLFTLLTPEMVFTKLGFNYTGPIDGHDTELLIKTLKQLNKKQGPKLLHIMTKKGKGYHHAEENATKFHGIGAFNLKTGEKNGTCKVMTYSQSFSDIIVKLAKTNKKIVAITAAMCEGTGLAEFRAKYPKRFFDVGIAEQHAVTFAAGLATQGYLPVVAIYSTFMQRAFDQVIHDVALQNLPVIFALDRGGLVGDDGPTHHGTFDLSFMTMIPNLIVAAPKDEQELQDLFYSAQKYNKPIAIRYPRGVGTGVCIKPNPNFIEEGDSELLKKGNDIAIVGVGATIKYALEASQALKDKGIKASVINARFIKPIDKKLLNHLKKVKKAIVIEENASIGGLGSYIKSLLPSSVKIETIGLPDKFIEQGKISNLHKKYGLSTANIVRIAKRLVK